MDSIHSNPYFNPAHLYNQHQASGSKANQIAQGNRIASQEIEPSSKPAPYFNMFDDKELARLQDNLESIADLTGKALESLQSRS